MAKSSKAKIKFREEIRREELRSLNHPTKFRKHRIAGGFDGVKLKRGFIPNNLKATDKPWEIVDLYGVSYGTACVWLRILRGPNYMP